MSKVPAHWDEIGKVVGLRNKLAPETLIVGNGDVRDRQHGEELARQYGVDGIMIGRGVFHNPFGFEKTPRLRSREELIDLLKFQLDLFDTYTPERTFDPLKRFFKIYIRDFPGASELRVRLMSTRSTEQVREILSKTVMSESFIA